MGGAATSITLNQDEFVRLYKQAGEASLIDLSLDGKDEGKVLIHDIAYDPVSDEIIHVDLRRIDMNKTMTATVELRFVGEAPVIKEQGGTLMHNISEVEVKCLPKDLISHIDVDVSVLKTFDDLIKVKDLTVPGSVTITNPNAEDLVAKATPAMSEEEMKAMEEASKSAVDLSKIEATLANVRGILRHIRNVQDNCILMGERLIERGQIDLGRKLIANGMKHDNSKFYGIEYEYMAPTYVTGPAEDTRKMKLRLAIEHHTKTNKHHPKA
jgi:large subunit ribosomal protein L25